MIIQNPDMPTEQSKAPAVPMKDTAPLPPMDPPPPYESGAINTTPAAPRSPPSPPPSQLPTPSSVFRPTNVQTVNHFELYSKHDGISGTFLVDPLLPAPSSTMCKKLRRKRDKVWGKSSMKTDVNAAFHTRHGAINIDMGVVAHSPSTASLPPGTKVTARIIVSSRHGRINVDMHEVHPSRSVDLHVETRHGKVTILLPPTFDGPLVFNTRHANSVHFLPEFEKRMRTLRASDRETVVLCHTPDSPSRLGPLKPVNQMADEPVDRCLVRTRMAKIIVGISGLDRVEEPPPAVGLFQTLGRLFETQGKAFGQYMEAQAKSLEKTMSGRGEVLGRFIDDMNDGTGARPRGRLGSPGPLGAQPRVS